LDNIYKGVNRGNRVASLKYAFWLILVSSNYKYISLYETIILIEEIKYRGTIIRGS